MHNGILYIKDFLYKSNYEQSHLGANIVNIDFVFMSCNEIDNERKL